MKFLLLILHISFVSLPYQLRAESIKDSRGRKVVLKKNARIISGFVGADEILFEILKDDRKRLLALSPLAKDERYSAIYKEARSWSREFGAELESLLALKPDLVIVASYSRPEWLKILDQAKISTYVLGEFESVEDIRKNILILGKLVGREKRARELLADFDQDLGRLSKSCSKEKVRMMNFSENGIVYGKGTIFDSALKVLGLVNAASDSGIRGWAKVSRENILVMNPDYLIVEGSLEEIPQRRKMMQSQVGWKHLKAVRQGKLVAVPSRYLSSVSHHLIRAMEQICEQI